MDVLKTLKERGFIEQTTHDEELETYLSVPGRSCYIGFDPTADSLHIGSLVPIMALAQMQHHGHRPIALVGGGTGLVGDPSGKTEMRKILTLEQVAANVESLRRQLSRFLNFDEGRACLENNADWLVGLGYIPFLRDVGRHFSVNRMIKAESCRLRMDSEEGLSFIEFNYMLLQAYDFMHLCESRDCRLQMGGSDQWGNIVAGIDLIRRMHGKSAFGITFPLITTASGAKMGKTAKGAVWLDAQRTTPYDYYQYWVNTADDDVARFLALYTFLPMDEIRAVRGLEGAQINAAKIVLAWETTCLVHGAKEALKAYEASASVFGKRQVPERLLASSRAPRGQKDASDGAVPQSEMSLAEIESGPALFKVLVQSGLAASGGAARRLIQQGGAYVNGERVRQVEYELSPDDIDSEQILLRAGKKRFHKIKIVP